MSSRAHADDPRAKITAANGESVTFEYPWPFVDISGGSRSQKHECIGTEPYVQHLGPAVTDITIRGHCYLDEANFIDDLGQSERIRIRNHRYNGYALVDDHDTSTTGERGGVRDLSESVFDYTIKATAVSPPE